MRFYRHLTEQNYYSQEEVIEILQKNCSEYLKVLKSLGSKEKILENMLYRGIKGKDKYPEKGINKIKPRENRKPKDTPEEIHELLDDLFKRKFGWSVRSKGVFATSDVGNAKDFGIAFPFFPADGFKFVYTWDIEDLLTELDYQGIIWQTSPDTWEMREDIDWEEVKTTLKSIVNSYTDKNLSNAIQSRVEISFGCKFYYLTENDMPLPIAEKLAKGEI